MAVDRMVSAGVVDRFLGERPVDVREMSKALGIRIETKALPDSISGKIERVGLFGDDYVITVNSGHSATRQRFTIAHEIAHFILHRDLIGDGIVDDALYRDHRLGDERERQANRYAASLLMPRRQVREAWDNGAITKGALARAFDVSPAVAEIRMRELGCVLWPKPAQNQVF
ncbi:protein of unknown function [Fulvimarina manganoxydans]|uniref:IrrE N-terminal-like domain-containing protein n=1 Tax=Fulvimarina manganoxydans TaxID=937218 RepID=A0A1W2EEB3_9HYPH|nr:ImmA/IrrE family metallo-endopeptidase [Fulvimarina manganoxydans]SMD08015.1 protein of unknown function [Fulvimarina manganoxydans]